MPKMQKDFGEELERKEIEEEINNTEINLADENGNEEFEMICGYTDEDGVVHKSFTLREINGKDEEAINKGEVKKNTSKVVTVLLTRCVTSIGTLTPKTVGVKKWEEIIKNLYVGDQDYMLLQLRKISVGSEIELGHECPHCKQKLRTVVDIDELEIKPFSGEHKIEFTLPRGYKDKKGVTHKEGVMRLPTGLDREILTPIVKNNTAKATTVMLTRVCKFNDGLPVTDDVISELCLKDRNYLGNLLDEHNFGVKLEVEVTCDSCGETFTGNFNAVNFL